MKVSSRPVVALLLSGLTLLSVSAARAANLARIAPYPQMAPVSKYLMTRSEEIALARSAAPASISNGAKILVLGPHGYETVSTGSNGFTCLVERGWMSPFDSTDFWNPRLRGPICYNPPASRTVLLYTLKRTELILGGASKAQTMTSMVALVSKKMLPNPEAGSMSYMMSRNQYLGDRVAHWYPHLMLHAPKSDGSADGASWGADLDGSPVMLDTSHREVPEPETIFMIPVGEWSDGTAAPTMKL